MHHGERNFTSTSSKLSKTFSVSAPHPWLVAISRERIARCLSDGVAPAARLQNRACDFRCTRLLSDTPPDTGTLTGLRAESSRLSLAGQLYLTPLRGFIAYTALLPPLT